MWEKYYQWSPYQYAGNNPISLVDFNGKESFVRSGTAYTLQDLLNNKQTRGVIDGSDNVDTKGIFANIPNHEDETVFLDIAWFFLNPTMSGVDRHGNQWSAIVPFGGAIGKGTKALSSGFKSFSAFKRFFGKAGTDKHWHHIVEQHADNIAKFGAENIHNSDNLIKLNAKLHAKITGHYNSKITQIGITYREFLKSMTYEEQYQYGLQQLVKFGWKP